MGQPQDSALLHRKSIKNRSHVHRQIEILMDLSFSNAPLPPLLFPFGFPPAVTQKIGRGLVEISLARSLVKRWQVKQANIGFLQNLFGGGGIVSKTAQVSVQSPRSAQVESLELSLRRGLVRLRSGHSDLPGFHCRQHLCQTSSFKPSFLARKYDITAETKKPIPAVNIT